MELTTRSANIDIRGNSQLAKMLKEALELYKSSENDEASQKVILVSISWIGIQVAE